MSKEKKKLYLKDMTQQKMYKLFGLRKTPRLQELDDWLSNLPTLNEREKIVAEIYQNRLVENIDMWNEQELSLGFIGPILNLVSFKIPYQLNLFAQRPIAAEIGEYELIGKPDGILASGFQEPEIPYFSFHEYKKEIDNSGDPAGQNLAAMLVGQYLNDDKSVIYGCYVVGRNWFFMVLKDKHYAISKDFSSSDEEIFDVIGILKSLRNILHKKLITN